MISLRHVTHSIERRGKRIAVLSDASFDFDLRRMGLLSGQEEQSEALVDLLAGYLLPEDGTIKRHGAVSWPLGRLAQFRSELTGRDTVRFLSQLYGLQIRLTEDFFHSLIDFGDHYDQSISGWPRLLNVKFGHAAVLLPNFDVYLVEGSVVISDPGFMELWMPRFQERLQRAQLIMSCNQMAYLAQFCKTVAVLKDEQLVRYADVSAAFQAVAWTPVEAQEPRDAAEKTDDRDDQLL